MKELFIFLIIVVIVLLGISNIMSNQDEYKYRSITYICGVLFTCLAMGIITSSPSAMDVYRGKTELLITYKNSVPIDSIVVYKNDLKN